MPGPDFAGLGCNFGMQGRTARTLDEFGAAIDAFLAGDGPIPVGNTPKEFSDYIKSEQTKWSKVIRLANIQID